MKHNFFHHTRISLKASSLIVFAIIAGCAATNSENQRQQAQLQIMNLDTNSVLTKSEADEQILHPNQPNQFLFLKVKSPRYSRELISKFIVNDWQNVREDGSWDPKIRKELTDAQPYLFLTLKSNKKVSFQLVPIALTTAIDSSRSSQDVTRTVVTTKMGTIEGITDIELMACPNAPFTKLSDCMVATQGNAKIQELDGSVENKYFRLTRKFSGETFYTMFSAYRAEYTDRSEKAATLKFSSKTELEKTFVAAEEKYAVIVKNRPSQAEQDAQNRKRREAEQAAKAAELAKEKQSVVVQSPTGTTIFCNSGKNFLLLPGKDINSVVYTCDLLRSGQTIWLNELLNAGWDIASEQRSPEETAYGKTGYVVSLRLKKLSSR